MPSFVIDGYNLIHALGLLCGKAGPGDLERSRRLLLERLQAGFSGRAAQVTVVFDASRGPGAIAHDLPGITCIYTPGDREADDVIEDLIRAAAVPRQLAIVSSDRRLKEAASRRGAIAMSCSHFLDWLEQPLPAAAPPVQDEKGLPGPDDDRLLQEFKHLDDDLKMLNDTFKDE